MRTHKLAKLIMAWVMGSVCGAALAQEQAGQPGGATPALMASDHQDEMYRVWRERVDSVDAPQELGAQDQKIVDQIKTFRKRLQDAIEAKDAAKLNDYFADDYIITLGNALVDGKKSRLQWLLSGRAPFEVQPVDTAQFRVLDRDNVIMTANQRYTMGGTHGSPIQYGVLRSLFVFTKDRPSPGYKGWRLVASQSLRAPVVPPRAPVYGKNNGGLK